MPKSIRIPLLRVREAVLKPFINSTPPNCALPSVLGVGEWKVNGRKKAVLLSFRIRDNEILNDGVNNTSTKCRPSLPSDFGKMSSPQRRFPRSSGCRCPPRQLCGEKCRVDAFLCQHRRDTLTKVRWSILGRLSALARKSVKTCASGGVGIGGVLEPLQASPYHYSDNCFIGARSEIVEGVIVEEGSVISMGVFIGQSTKSLDRTTGEIYQGRVPAGSVVVSGSMPSKDSSHSLYCAVISNDVDAQTRAKKA